MIDVTLYVPDTDGCEAENDHIDIEWPETDLGVYTNSACPCSEFIGTLAGRALRFCGGDYVNGARWNDNVVTKYCVALTSAITGRLCKAAKVSSCIMLHNKSNREI